MACVIHIWKALLLYFFTIRYYMGPVNSPESAEFMGQRQWISNQGIDFWCSLFYDVIFKLLRSHMLHYKNCHANTGGVLVLQSGRITKDCVV